jgi:YVTN family beta-propeller protein
VLSAFGSIWVANHFDDTVSRLDPSTGRVEGTIAVGEGPNALTAAAGSVWVANEFDGSITAIDPATGTAEQALPVGGEVLSLTTAGDGLWLAVGASATQHRGGVLTVSSEDKAPKSLDPAVVYDPIGWSILSITNDGLLAYQKAGGPEGTNLVPDLASALPQVSPDGLTYRFPLLGGIRYSTGDPVRPDDFRRGLERSISLEPAAAGLFAAIEGAEACGQEPASCDLSDSIVVDSEAVTFHLARPDADLPFKLALSFASPSRHGPRSRIRGWTPCRRPGRTWSPRLAPTASSWCGTRSFASGRAPPSPTGSWTGSLGASTTVPAAPSSS